MFKLREKFMKLKQRMDDDHKRNLMVLVVACVLNFSFALEKLFIVVGNQLPDAVWMTIYGGLGVYLAYIAVKDYMQDVIEECSSSE